jgi:hypothetical protein
MGTNRRSQDEVDPTEFGDSSFRQRLEPSEVEDVDWLGNDATPSLTKLIVPRKPPTWPSGRSRRGFVRQFDRDDVGGLHESGAHAMNLWLSADREQGWSAERSP